jgi:hypothetical protein
VTAAYLFGSTFVLVFALGFQSLNVNGGHYWLAFFTSFAIGAANLVLYKLAPNANAVEMAAFLLGGPFGIVASMAAHRRFVTRKATGRPDTDDLVPRATAIAPDSQRALDSRVVALREECRLGEDFRWNSMIERNLRPKPATPSPPRPPGLRSRRDD